MSKIVDETGFITCPKVRAHYDRIIGRAKWSIRTERPAEAYLRLVLRLERQGKWDHDNATLKTKK